VREDKKRICGGGCYSFWKPPRPDFPPILVVTKTRNAAVRRPAPFHANFHNAPRLLFFSLGSDMIPLALALQSARRKHCAGVIAATI
jgi:hypothetical protein